MTQCRTFCHALKERLPTRQLMVNWAARHVLQVCLTESGDQKIRINEYSVETEKLSNRFRFNAWLLGQ